MSKESSLVLLLISTLVLFVMLYFMNKTKSRKKLVKYFSILIVLLLIWNLGLILQLLLAERLNVSPIYFDFITYFGIVFVPVTLALLAVTFINPEFKLKKKHLLFLVIPITSLIMLYTNDFHHLFYINYSTVLNEIVYGPFLYLHLAYTYSLIAISLILLLKHSIKLLGVFSIQSFLFLIAITIPVVINIAGMLDIFNGMDIYLTPISFALSFLFIAISIFRFDFLSINTIATQFIVKAISDSYLVLNRDNEITLYNKAFLDNFKIKEEDLLNHSIFNVKEIRNIFSKDDIEVSLELIKNTNQKITLEKYFEKTDKYFSVDISPILKNNRYIGTLIILKDVTEKEHDKLQIKANQDLLVEQERLASLGQMIGGIAHNLKTPIFSITGGLEGLSDLIKEFDESIDDPQVTSKDMHDIAKDMDDWIIKLKEHIAYMSDVITTVRGQTVTMSESQNSKFTVKELFDHTMILMQHELKEKLTVLNVSNNVPYSASIYGNINSLVQVINNLISNAIEAYENTDKEKIINLSATYNETDKHIIISVQDFGPGLPEDVQQKIFKEMITTKGKYGTGLRIIYVIFKHKSTFQRKFNFQNRKKQRNNFRNLSS